MVALGICWLMPLLCCATEGCQMVWRGFQSVIIASSPHPYAIPSAGYLARRYGSRLIVEVRDLWPASLVQLTGISPHHPFVWFTAWFERYAYRRADCLVSLMPLAEPYMRKRGLPPDRFTYIPNGATISEIPEPKDIEPFPLLGAILQSKEDRYFNLCYAGAIGEPNNLELLLNAAALLQSQKDLKVRVFVIGKGDQQETLERMSCNLGLKNIFFCPPVAKREILIILRHADAGFISLQTKPLFFYGVSPNKLFDYMLCSLPVIFAIDAGNNPVQDADCGFSVSPDSPQQVAETIQKLASMPSQQRARLGDNGYRYLIAHHDYFVLAERYMRLFA